MQSEQFSQSYDTEKPMNRLDVGSWEHVMVEGMVNVWLHGSLKDV